MLCDANNFHRLIRRQAVITIVRLIHGIAAVLSIGLQELQCTMGGENKRDSAFNGKMHMLGVGYGLYFSINEMLFEHFSSSAS